MRESDYIDEFQTEQQDDVVERIRKKGMSILIMKNSSLTKRQYHRGLEEKGFTVDLIEHGSSALRAMIAGKYDLIIIEVQMLNTAQPTEDLLPLEVLRFYLENHRVPVVVVGKPYLWDADRLAAYGVAAVVEHSSSKADVVNAVLQALDLIPKPAEKRWAPAGERPQRQARAA